LPYSSSGKTGLFVLCSLLFLPLLRRSVETTKNNRQSLLQKQQRNKEQTKGGVMTAQTIDTEIIKQNADITVLAGRYTTLRRASAGEWAGPCPKCGGDDRFHVKRDWFFCRQCHEKRGDAIAFLQWAGGLGFQDACAALSGGSLPAVTNGPVTPKQAKAKGYTLPPGKARAIGKAARSALSSPAGGPGRVYLVDRGLWPETWETFGLGYCLASLPGTWNPETKTHSTPKQPAICMPWTLGNGTIPAIRYRFLNAQPYTDIDGKERTEKQTAQFASDFIGKLFGGCALSGPDRAQTLVLCEGEINAMSIWQATAGEIDVLSLGSESVQLSKSAIRAILRYGRVIVWVDKGEIAQQFMRALPGVVGFKSPNGKDANDWLKAQHLAEIVQGLLALGDE
jgi:DNA primase